MRTANAVYRRRPLEVAVALLAVGALLVAGCGDDDDDESSESSALVGVWEATSGGLTWVVAEDTITATVAGEEIVSQYTVTDTTIELVDEPGPNACPPGQAGTYEWEVDGDTMQLTVVTDPCGRVNTLDGATFERGE